MTDEVLLTPRAEHSHTTTRAKTRERQIRFVRVSLDLQGVTEAPPRRASRSTLEPLGDHALTSLLYQQARTGYQLTPTPPVHLVLGVPEPSKYSS